MEHKQLVASAVFLLMVIQEQRALHIKVEIQRMKAVAVVEATSAVVEAEITPVVQVDLAMLHF